MTKKRLHALLIGINAYQGAPANLEGCVNDMQLLGEYLETRIAGDRFEPPRVRLLLDEQATRQGIITAFREHFHEVRPGDAVLVGYAGHGSQESAPEEFWREKPEGLLQTLVCHDSRAEPSGPDDARWDLADKELRVLLAEVAAKQPDALVVLLDSCHSGTATRSTGATRVRCTNDRKGIRPIESFFFHEQALREGWYEEGVGLPLGKHVVLAACQAGEEAKEVVRGSPRGAFSYYLLEQLNNAHQGLTYRELFQRVAGQVKVQVHRQSPQLEGLEGGDIDALFLEGASDAPPARAVTSTGGGKGTLDAGAIHGIPQPSDGPTRLGLYSADGPLVVPDLSNPLGTVLVTAVEAEKSAVRFEQGAPPEGQRFRAYVLEMPRPRCQASFLGAAEQVTLLGEAFARVKPAYVGLADPQQPPTNRILVEARPGRDGEEGRFVIMRPVDGTRLVADVVGFSPDNAEKVIRRLDHIARWTDISLLTNAETRLPASALEVALLGPRGDAVIASSAGDAGAGVELRYRWEDDVWVAPLVRVRVRNTGSQRLYVSAIGLTQEYEVVDVFVRGGGAWVEPGQDLWFFGGNAFPLEIPAALGPEATRTRDLIKVFGSTEEFDPSLLRMPKLDVRGAGTRAVGQVSGRLNRLLHRAATRAFGAPVKHDPSDWQTWDLPLVTIRPLGAAINADASAEVGAGLSVEPHPALEGVIREVAPPQQLATRSTAAQAPPLPSFGEPFTLRPGTRSDGPPPILELSKLKNHKAVTPETPLRLQTATPLAAEDSLLVFAYDGDVLLPVGRGQGAEGGTTLTIDRLPDPQGAQGTRSVTGSISLFVRKLVGSRVPSLELYTFPRLAIPSVSEQGKVSYDDTVETLRERVAAAERVVMFIHGILGDTEGMARCAVSPVANEADEPVRVDDLYDLVLTFDYENLNTPIATIARELKQRLEAVGLGPRHGKVFDIVAHSMGGLVSRQFIEREGGRDVVSRLTMLGTPNGGSPWSNVEDWARTTLTFAANALGGFGLAGDAAGLLADAMGAVDVTLEQMNPESEFLTGLRGSPDPGVPYAMVAGNLDLIGGPRPPEEGSRMRRLLRKLLPSKRTLYAPFDRLFGEPHDIAVSLESMQTLPEWSGPRFRYEEVACDHCSYFTSEPGQRALIRALTHTEPVRVGG